MVILKDILDKEPYDLTMEILYKIRRNKSYGAYHFFVKMAFVDAVFNCGHTTFRYENFLYLVEEWYKSNKTYSEFCCFDLSLTFNENATYKGVRLDDLLYGSLNTVIEQVNSYIRQAKDSRIKIYFIFNERYKLWEKETISKVATM